MRTGRFVVAVISVWVVRVALNWTFYTQIVGEQFERIYSAHPEMFQEVVPAYIATDLLFAILFVYFFGKVGDALGGGVKGGLNLGVAVALLCVLVGTLYDYYTFTFLSAGLAAGEVVFQLIAHAAQGAVGGIIWDNWSRRGAST